MSFGRIINSFFYSRKEQALSLDKENDTFVEISHERAYEIYLHSKCRLIGTVEYYVYPDLAKNLG